MPGLCCLLVAQPLAPLPYSLDTGLILCPPGQDTQHLQGYPGSPGELSPPGRAFRVLSPKEVVHPNLFISLGLHEDVSRVSSFLPQPLVLPGVCPAGGHYVLQGHIP